MTSPYSLGLFRSSAILPVPVMEPTDIGIGGAMALTVLMVVMGALLRFMSRKKICTS